MSHKLAPLGRTHIRQGSSTPETTSESSSPLKVWIYTQNFGGSPSVSPELKQLSGKNTVTREVVHVAEAARLNSTSSSSDGLVTKMHIARASVASVSSVSSKNTIAPKVTNKSAATDKATVAKPVNKSMEKVLAERQKIYEEAKAKKIAEAAAAKAQAVERAKEAHKAAVEKAAAERKAKQEAARKEKEAEDRIAEGKETVEIAHKKNLKDSDGHYKVESVSSGKKTAMSYDSHLSSGKENKIDDHAEGRAVVSGKYRVYQSKEYGNYVRVNDALVDVHSTNPKGKASLTVVNLLLFCCPCPSVSPLRATPASKPMLLPSYLLMLCRSVWLMLPLWKRFLPCASALWAEVMMPPVSRVCPPACTSKPSPPANSPLCSLTLRCSALILLWL